VREEICPIIDKRIAGEDSVVLVVRSSFSADLAPGQFVNIKVPAAGEDPFLRRPFSVAWSEPAEGTLELLIQRRGRGTAILADLPVGTELSLLGPLGRPFPVDALAREGAVDLVAGACGVAPLLMLAQALGRAAPAPQVRLCIGARRRDLIPEPDVLARRIPQVLFATDDGSAGARGDVVALYAAHRVAGRTVCGCGPRGLLESLRRFAADTGTRMLLSLESDMACGYGVCKGCVVMRADGAYATVCRDGPVFEAAELAPLANDG
jgi:dihydroorotate dehydrogenase electron transfer subunit